MHCQPTDGDSNVYVLDKAQNTLYNIAAKTGAANVVGANPFKLSKSSICGQITGLTHKPQPLMSVTQAKPLLWRIALA